MTRLTDILQLLKIKHYIKNLVIFIPVIFTKNLNDWHTLFVMLFMFAVFCLMSSIIYIFNDLQDVEKDKMHPIKCYRPIASGRIAAGTAKKILVALLLSICCLSFFINTPCNLCIWGYFVLNICYSLILKNFRFIDIFCIAFGFVLRILTGFYVLMLPISFALCLMIFVTSIFFTSSKRLLELKLTSNTKNYHSSAQYTNIFVLNNVIYCSAVLSVIAYCFAVFEYTRYIHYLYISILCFVLFIGRLLYLANKPQNHDDPMNFMEKDKILKIISVGSLFVLAILYWF